MRQDLSATLAAAIANPLGFIGKPTLSIYLDTGTVTWTWDDGQPHAFDVGSLYAGNALDPTSIEVTLYSAEIITGTSTIEQAALGAAAPFRGRRITLGLAIETEAGTETLILFDGAVTLQKANTVGVTLEATGAMSSADRRSGTLPVELMCPWVLYGADCGATKHTETLTTASGSTETALHVSSVGTAAVADLAELASGETARVRAVATGVLTLDRPVTPPASGESVTLTWGCSKNLGLGGCARHGNQARFGGSPCRPVKAITAG